MRIDGQMSFVYMSCKRSERPIWLCHCLLRSSCSFLAKLSSNFTVCSVCGRRKHEGILAEGNLYTGLFVTEILLTSRHALLAFKVMNKSLVLNMNSILVSAYSKDCAPRWFTLITTNMRFIVNISAKHNLYGSIYEITVFPHSPIDRSWTCLK